MKVKATQDGFDGVQYRKKGDVFEYNGKELGSWMEKVDQKTVQLSGQQEDELKAGKPVSGQPAKK